MMIKWDGTGIRPSARTMVKVRLRGHKGGTSSPYPTGSLNWCVTGSPGDIVEYEVVDERGPYVYPRSLRDVWPPSRASDPNVGVEPGQPPGHLPLTADRRKALPVYSGFVKYFPDAIVAVAELSMKGNEQHNPGKPLHWDRSKSGDELDALSRHLVDAGTLDTDGVRHSTKVAWRALANLQKEIERERTK